MSDLHSRSAQRRVAAMTPPPEPRTAAGRALLDWLNRADNLSTRAVRSTSPEAIKRIIAIEAEAASLGRDNQTDGRSHRVAGGSRGVSLPPPDGVAEAAIGNVPTPEAAAAPLRAALQRILDHRPYPGDEKGYRYARDVARAALAASSYFGQPPPDDWEDMPADATPAPAPLDETRLIGALSLAIERHKANRSWAHRCETMCAVQIGGYLYARLTARAAATEPEQGPCDHVSPTYGPCTVVGRHQRAAGPVHVYAARPIVIGDESEARAAATEDTP